jgi:F0F1-type ATP synthase membrane subunit b/b'
MANLVEDVVSLEKEADTIVAQAHAEAKELGKLAIEEAEAYRRKRAEETEQKVVAFQKEMEEKHKSAVAETEKDLARALNTVDQIAGNTLKEQISKIVTKFSEL